MRIHLLRLLCAIGLGLSVYLVWQHATFTLSGETGGLCGVVPAMRCEVIEASNYSEWMGIPTASFGVFFFLVFFVFLFAFAPQVDYHFEDDESDSKTDSASNEDEPPPDPYWGIALVLATVGLASSLALAYISAFVIHGFCLGCTLVYAVTLAIMATVIHWRRPFQFFKLAFADLTASVGHPGDWLKTLDSKSKNRVIIALMVLGVAAPVNFGLIPYLLFDTLCSKVRQTFLDAPVIGVEFHPWTIQKGAPDAPLQIVVFSDFECPGCRNFDKRLKEALESFNPKDYRLIFKHFPLGKECNPLIQDKSPIDHRFACALAAMGQAAADMGRFWEAKELLYQFEEKNTLDGTIREIAIRTGLSYTDWTTRARDKENMRRVVLDVGEALKLGARGAPVFLVNYRPVDVGRVAQIRYVLNLALDMGKTQGLTIPTPFFTPTRTATPAPTPTP